MKTISSVAIMALVAQSSAFAPSYRSSSFVQKQQQLPAGNLPSISSSSRTRTSSSSLSMNLFDRFARVAKANANNILKGLEDPEKILNQAVEDMQVRKVLVSTSSSSIMYGSMGHGTDTLMGYPREILYQLQYYTIL